MSRRRRPRSPEPPANPQVYDAWLGVGHDESADCRRTGASGCAATRGTIAATDGDGQFVLPWPFTGTVTVRVSKDGFHARERLVPEPGAPGRPVHLGFELEAIDAPIIVAGMYQLALTAASECTQLPSVVRQRAYRAQVYPNGLGRFSAELFDGDFPYGSVISLEVRSELLRVRVATAA